MKTTATFDPSLYVVVPRAKWLVAFQVPVEIPGQRPQLAHAVPIDAQLFDTCDEACQSIKDRALPLGWVTMTVDGLLPTLFAAAPALPEQPQGEPLNMVLLCPRCFQQHVDAPEPEKGWSNPPHKSHLCHHCGNIWRPADVPTNGVATIATRGSADTWPEPIGPIPTLEEMRGILAPAGDPAVRPATATDSYVQEVPDHCDRIIWRNRYYHLPLKAKDSSSISAAESEATAPAVSASVNLRNRALALYEPPFRYDHGYIFDARHEMVSDGELDYDKAIQRVRGWGRLQYMDEAEKLQDTMGALIAEALTEFWTPKHGAITAGTESQNATERMNESSAAAGANEAKS